MVIIEVEYSRVRLSVLAFLDVAERQYSLDIVGQSLRKINVKDARLEILFEFPSKY
jgi:hypothetical protein